MEQINLGKILNHTSVVLMFQDFEKPFNFRFISSNIENVLGYSPEVFLCGDLKWEDNIHPEDVKNYLSNFSNKELSHFHMEYRYKIKNGDYRWVRDEIVRVFDGADKYLVRTIVDVTSCRRVADILNTILDSMEEGLVILDKEYGIRKANKGFSAILGEELEKVINMNFFDILEKKIDLSEIYILKKAFNELLDKKASQKVSVRLFNKNGFLRNIDVHLYPVKSSSDFIESILGVFIDITEKKQIEDQLNYIQKMETIGQLSAGIAHDFNNILTAVIGFASFIDLKLEENSPLKTYTKNILTVSERGANLIKSLLTFSRKRDFLPQRIELNRLIKNMELILQKVAGEHINLKLELCEKELVVIADSTQIEQVLLNLITNSRDAIEGDNGKIIVKTEKFSINEEFIKRHGFGMPGDYALIKVSDNGLGMDEEVLKKVFEPFFTTKEVNKGTGLGLSIVYGIVKQHNGFIEIKSQKGVGTDVYIYLPLLNEEKVFTEEIERVFLTVKGGNETILVAEDDDYVRDLINQILTNAGYKVVLAKDGKEAVSKFLSMKNEIRLAILDVIMPYKNGGEVFNEIRLVNPTVSVIFLSGYSAEFVNGKTVLSKQATFLAKPVSPKDLLLKVRNILDGKEN